MTPEGKVKAELKKYLESLGADCWYYMPVPIGYGKRGVPDFIICYKGFFLAPETKKISGGVSGPLQTANQVSIRNAGGHSERVTIVNTVKMWVQFCDRKYEILKAAQPLSV